MEAPTRTTARFRANPMGFGNNLATYVDNGGWVVLGALCTYCSGNCLRGTIMTAAYCPVYSPSLSNHFSPAGWSGDDADACEYWGLAPGWQAYYRDYLALQGAGLRRGTFTDGEIACAVGPGNTVYYVNGSGGSPILWDPNIEQVVANVCDYCFTSIPPWEPPPPPVPTVERSWGSVKGLYR